MPQSQNHQAPNDASADNASVDREDLRVYASRVDEAFANLVDEVIMNSSPEHAAIILRAMFRSARRRVRILARICDKLMFGDSEMLRQMQQFAEREGTTVEILFEEFDENDRDDHALIELARNYGNIVVRRMDEALREAVTVNFALMDDTGYRYEADNRKAKAIANPNSPEDVEPLNALFQKIWDFSLKRNPKALA